MTGGGLTLRALVADVPHDAPAIFIYALLLACLVLAWRGGRSRGAPPEAEDATTPPNHSTGRQR